MNSALNHMNIVLNFHEEDQQSAALLLNLLILAEEGIACTYYLQYGDDVSTLNRKAALSIIDFMSKKDAHFSNELPDIIIPAEMIEDDPNQEKYGGNHTLKTTKQKIKILQWNRCIYKYIQQLDNFLSIEPDSVVFRNGWLNDIYQEWIKYDGPIFGHLRRGRIGNDYIPTHWVGSSVYNCKVLRELPLEKYFYERYTNPWWQYRDLPGTVTASNCLHGPAFSGYDIAYDYFLFSLYWREKTGVNDPLKWPIKDLKSRKDLIFCDFRTLMSADEIFSEFAGKLPHMHGIKDDEIRKRMIPFFRSGGGRQRSRFKTGKPKDKRTFIASGIPLQISDLKNKFKGERCFIIGNGPSLKNTDMELLKEEYTIGLNRIYLNYENMGFEPTFYCCVNSHVLEQFAEDIDKLKSIKFLRDKSKELVKNHWNTFFMGSIPGGMTFNRDLKTMTWYEGWTVTYCAMQVAFYMGFKNVYLIGVDHSFKNAGNPNELVTADSHDKNHFHPEYFGKGVKWQYPDLGRSEECYKMAKKEFERKRRKIFDATIGGSLDIFPKVDYLKLFSQK